MRLDELFKGRLHDAEAEVPNGVWDKLEAGLNEAMPQSGNAASSSGTSLASSAKVSAVVGKTIAGIALAALAGGGVYLLNRSDVKEEKPVAKTETRIVEAERNTMEAETKKTIEVPKKRNAVSISPNADLFFSNAVSEIENGEMVKEEEKEVANVAETVFSPAATAVQSESISPAKPVEQQRKEQSVPQKEVCEAKPQERQRAEAAFEPAIGIPNLVSPNNDGINDRFEIRNIEKYPDNELVIFDRRGKVVFRAVSYANDWAAEGLADGAYFYRFAVREGSKQKIFTGNINVMR